MLRGDSRPPTSALNTCKCARFLDQQVHKLQLSHFQGCQPQGQWQQVPEPSVLLDESKSLSLDWGSAQRGAKQARLTQGKTWRQETAEGTQNAEKKWQPNERKRVALLPQSGRSTSLMPSKIAIVSLLKLAHIQSQEDSTCCDLAPAVTAMYRTGSVCAGRVLWMGSPQETRSYCKPPQLPSFWVPLEPRTQSTHGQQPLPSWAPHQVAAPEQHAWSHPRVQHTEPRLRTLFGSS